MINSASHRGRPPNIKDYIDILLRRLWVLIVVFVVLLSTVAIATFNMTPIYEAATTVQVEEEAGETTNPLLGELAKLAAPSKILTEIEIVRSRSIAEKVVRELNLQRQITFLPRRSLLMEVIKFITSRIRKPPAKDALRDETGPSNPSRPFDFGHIEVPDRLTGTPFFIEFVDDRGNFHVLDRDKTSIGTGRIGEPFKEGGLSFLLRESSGRRGDRILFQILGFQRAVSGLQANTHVVQLGRETDIIRVSVKHTDPSLARDIANTIAHFYLQQEITRKSQEATQALGFIEGQLDDVNRRLEVSEMELRNFKSTHGVVSLPDMAKECIRQIASLEGKKAQINLELRQVENLRASMKKGIQKDFNPSGVSVLDDRVISQMLVDLSRLEGERSSLLTDFTANHPKVISLTSEISELRSRIEASLENTVHSLKKRLEKITAIISKENGTLKELPIAEKTVAELTRNTKVNENIYTFLLTKRNEARIARASTIGNIRVIDPAIGPMRPISPRVKLNLLLAFISALVLGVGLAYFFEYLDDSIKSKDVLERDLELPVFGIIPSLNHRRRLKGMPYPELISSETSHNPGVESYRMLQANIEFADPERGPKIFLITSALPGEGKTFNAANLGITLAFMEKRTLLIDADLRKPKLHHVFKAEKEPGLAHILTKSDNWEERVQGTPFSNLSLIACGAIPPNPTKLLSSERMRGFLSEARRNYDVILVDSPPVLPTTDPSVLGRMTDGIFIVVKSGETALGAVEEAKRRLEQSGNNVIGAIMNRLKPLSGYGYRYYYYYHYRYYGHGEGEKRRSRSSWPRSLTRLLTK